MEPFGKVHNQGRNNTHTFSFFSASAAALVGPWAWPTTRPPPRRREESWPTPRSPSSPLSSAWRCMPSSRGAGAVAAPSPPPPPRLPYPSAPPPPSPPPPPAAASARRRRLPLPPPLVRRFASLPAATAAHRLALPQAVWRAESAARAVRAAEVRPARARLAAARSIAGDRSTIAP